jgi:hypothetical protein
MDSSDVVRFIIYNSRRENYRFGWQNHFFGPMETYVRFYAIKVPFYIIALDFKGILG